MSVDLKFGSVLSYLGVEHNRFMLTYLSDDWCEEPLSRLSGQSTLRLSWLTSVRAGPRRASPPTYSIVASSEVYLFSEIRIASFPISLTELFDVWTRSLRHCVGPVRDSFATISSSENTYTVDLIVFEFLKITCFWLQLVKPISKVTVISSF